MKNDMVGLRRKLTDFNIRQNPRAITIERTEKVRSGGGYVEQKSSIGPFTVRLFMSASNSTVNQDVSLAGIQEKNTWGLLAYHDADIKAGTNVTDRFTCDLGTFEVKVVYPQVVNGQYVGIQGFVEKVT